MRTVQQLEAEIATTSGYFPYAKQMQEPPVTQGFVQHYI